MDENIVSMARDLLPDPDHSVASIARMLGVSPGTLYNCISGLRQRRTSERLPGQLEAAE